MSLIEPLLIVFLGVTVTLLPFSLFSVDAAKAGAPVTVTVLIALLVCLIPTTIAGLLSAIGVAGMSRMMQANVIATSDRAVEAAGAIHSDLEKHFIRAETIRWDQLLEAGSEANARAKGTLRLEGKDYIVQDGDVMHIRHSG